MSDERFRVAVDVVRATCRVDGRQVSGPRPARVATTLRGLPDVLGIDRAVLCGHSLGGGMAIATSYLFPERVDRLVLVSSGGFGTDLHPILRGATLPGAELLVRIAVGPRASRVLGHRRVHRTLGLRPEAVENLARIGRGVRTDAGRAAFFATLREAIDRRGQRDSMMEMGYVNVDLPTLLIWSEHDPVIPVEHGHLAARSLRERAIVLVFGSGHQPHRTGADQVAAAVARFVG